MSEPITNSRSSLVVLLSGGGTTLKNLLEKIAASQLAADIRLVISSNAQAGGLQIASASGIPAKVISRKAFTAPEAYSDAIFAACRAAGRDGS